MGLFHLDLQIPQYLYRKYRPNYIRLQTTLQTRLISIVNILDRQITHLAHFSSIFQHHFRGLLYNQFVLIIIDRRLYIS